MADQDRDGRGWVAPTLANAVAALGLIVILIICVMVRYIYFPSREQREFQREVARDRKLQTDAQSLLDKVRARKFRGMDEPYVRPKILFIVNDNHSFGINFVNPPECADVLGDRLATSIEDVRTIVVVNCGDVRVGDYIPKDHNPAYKIHDAIQQRCALDILDVSAPEITIGWRDQNVDGPSPAPEAPVNGSDSVYKGASALPYAINYIKRLPSAPPPQKSDEKSVQTLIEETEQHLKETEHKH